MFRNRPTASIGSGAASGAATAIQGSIRPPASSSDNVPYSRQQHLDSYLMDDTLSKSTRRVSTGMFFRVCVLVLLG
jgi:hypothetical protein